MTERGGPTTQSGILYQNSVAALYLGLLCDERHRPDAERVVRVRVEAPESVDDTVVYYADGHAAYIQSKERVQKGDEAWRKLWRDFLAQYHAANFSRGRDRLVLHVGETRGEYTTLLELCGRTGSSAEEWLDKRLKAPHRKLLSEIGTLLGPDLPGGDQALHDFFAHLDVELWPSQQLQRTWAPNYMPATSVSAQTLFRLLRDRVGGAARRRDDFEARTLREELRDENQVEFHIPPEIDTLRAAVHDCGAFLRQHKHTIGGTGVHLQRGVVQEIAAWALDDTHGLATGMLLDSAGTGKTVVMRDVMTALETRGATVLAIKADQQLSGIEEPEDLQRKLKLPEPVERVVGRLAALGPMVVIIDQVDALSLSMARDQRALNEVVSLVARLRELPGVVIILSCRTFDRNTDPLLKRMDIGRIFPLPLLEEEEVTSVLGDLGVEQEALTSATRELLRTPLHLDLFARVAQAAGPQVQGRGIRSLQDLYGIFWDEVVLQPVPRGPTPLERARALRVLAERMDREQRTSVPRSVFSTPQTVDLAPAADWLASAGVLIAGPEEWSLLHQTFFDYCYARFFVEDRRALAQHVLASDQGLFVRPQVVQVLAFLRGTRNPAYLRELSDMLGARGLRVHLRELLLRWLGALVDPTDDEWLLVRRLLIDPAMRLRVLGAMGGNPQWFARVRSGPLNDWLAGDADRIDQEVVPYLALLVDTAQAEVAEVAGPWVERDGPWLVRLRNLFWRVRDWRAPGMIELYERFLRTKTLVELDETGPVDDIAKADPAAGSRLVRIVLDAALDAFAKRFSTGEVSLFNALTDEFDALDGDSVKQAIARASKGDPQAFLDVMLPWLERAIEIVGSNLISGKNRYSSDPLSWWHSGHDRVHHALTAGFVQALVGLAQNDESGFRVVCERMASLPYDTPQRLLAEAYRELAPTYVADAFRFLLADPRRLVLGEGGAYDTQKLIESISPLLPGDQLEDLEEFVLSQSGRVERLYETTYDLRRRGQDQLFLLQSFPRDRLSERGRRTLGELERKFPGLVPVYPPRATMASFVGSPIGAPAAEKMSDAAWLGAMAKYAQGVGHKHDGLGGARELARVLQRRVQEESERFYALAERTPSDLDSSYVDAFLEGLVESTAPREYVFNLIRRFAPREDRNLRCRIAWVLDKVVAAGGLLPADLIELLGEWVRQPKGEDETHWEGESQDLLTGAINTKRGAAFQTLLDALALAPGNDALQARWAWMEYAADEPSVLLRAVALMSLLQLIDKDRDRSITLFERMAEGTPRLRESHPFQEFLYWGTFRRFSRLAPYIEQVMRSEPPATRRRGAELAVVWSISHRGLESDAARETAERLAEEAVSGPAEWRQGAAHIYAYNLVEGPTDLCVAGLRRLLNDEDEEVRREADGFVHRLREEHVLSLQGFLSDFAASRTYRESPHTFAEYLWENGLLNPAWALDIVRATLDNPHPSGRHSGMGGGEELVRLVLRLYTDPTADTLRREQAMDTFDRLMELHSGYAWMVLDEWDRG